MVQHFLYATQRTGSTARRLRFLPARRAAAFSNPFGDEFQTAIEGIESECPARVGALEKRGMAELRQYSGEERETMRMVLLFEAYQRFRAAAR